ncbi:MAG TPA: DUF4129 domain-containing protein [Anaerolineales bacterium]|nr:DUF4129 domain-containing protein [Anaerolineales bacterium]
MRKQLEDRRWGIALAFFALISLVLLAGALQNANFLPAQPLGGSESDQITIDLSVLKDALVNSGEIPLWKQFVFFGAIFLFLSLLALFLSPELRKKLFLMLLRLLASVIMVYYLLKVKPDIFSGLLQFGQLGQSDGQIQDVPAPVFEPPQISSATTFLLTLAFVVLVAFLFWLINRWWTRQKELIAKRRPLAEIAAIARASLHDLASASNSNDAIIQCYVRMSNVVAMKRGLQRQYAMTPAEFAAYLEGAGIPPEPISRLTGLFEAVRYGGHISGPREIDEASDCLKSILRYCGEAVS